MQCIMGRHRRHAPGTNVAVTVTMATAVASTRRDRRMIQFPNATKNFFVGSCWIQASQYEPMTASVCRGNDTCHNSDCQCGQCSYTATAGRAEVTERVTATSASTQAMRLWRHSDLVVICSVTIAPLFLGIPTRDRGRNFARFAVVRCSATQGIVTSH